MIYPVLIGRLLVLAWLAILSLTSFYLLQPYFISEGLDSSWIAALSEARHLNLRFGQDVIFTNGPLAGLYDRAFSRPLFYEDLLGVMVFTVFLTAFFGVTSVRARSLLAPCIAAIPLIFTVLRDPIFMSLPVCACLIGTLPDFRGYHRLLVIVGAVASAVATLAKFSVFPVAISAFLLVDVITIVHKRIPISLTTYAASLVVILWWTSPGASLWQFIKFSIDIANGYTGAMFSTGPLVEVVLVYATMITLVAMIGATEIKSLRTREVSLLPAASRVIIIAIFLFMCAKAGLVRHDGHAMIAWFGLALGAGLYCVFAWAALTRRAIGALVLVMMVGVGGTYRWSGKLYGLAPGAWAVHQLTAHFHEFRSGRVFSQHRTSG